MMRLTKILAAALVAAVMVGAAQAKPGSGGSPGGNRPTNGGRPGSALGTQGLSFKQTQVHDKHVVHDFKNVDHHDRVHLNHVDKSFKYSISYCPTKSYKQFGYGYCFYGTSCNHWEYRCWAPTYGCYTYYCPYTYCEYWQCVEDDCYYPVSYCPAAYRVKYKFGR